MIRSVIKKFFLVVALMSSFSMSHGDNGLAQLTGATASAEALRQALDGGLDPNRQDEFGQPLLFLAAVNKREDLVRLLIARGADAKVKDRNGFTVIDVVSANIRQSGTGRRAMIDAMKKQGLTEAQMQSLLGPRYSEERPGFGDADAAAWQKILDYLESVISRDGR